MTSVLYDAPGPKMRRNIRIGSVLGVLAVAAGIWFVVSRLASQGIFDAERWDIFSDPVVWEYLFEGLLATLQVAGIAAVGACILGAFLAALRLSENRFVSGGARVFVELFRGLPVLLLMYFPLVIFTALTPYVGAIIGLTLYNGAIIAEILRSGVRTLPRGQREAGLAIGLSATRSLRLIELPQAVRIMLPTLISQLVVLLKDTSLAYIITYPELLQQIRNLANYYGNQYLLPVFFVGVAIYIVVNFTFSMLANYLAGRGNRKAAGATTRRRAR